MPNYVPQLSLGGPPCIYRCDAAWEVAAKKTEMSIAKFTTILVWVCFLCLWKLLYYILGG